MWRPSCRKLHGGRHRSLQRPRVRPGRGVLERSDNVVGNARSQARLDQAAARLGNPSRFIGVASDIAEPTTAQQLFATALQMFGGVDILINNAGIFIAKPFAKCSEADVDALVGTNLKGFFNPAQEAARVMARQGYGQIIAITASIALQPDTRVPALLPVLVKGGLNQAVKGLALELAASGVQVNAVAPGIIAPPCMATMCRGWARCRPVAAPARPRMWWTPCCTWSIHVLSAASSCLWMAAVPLAPGTDLRSVQPCLVYIFA